MGESAGVLVLGRVLDSSLLKDMTNVDFIIDQSDFPSESADGIKLEDGTVRLTTSLTGLSGETLARLITITPRSITRLGQQTMMITLSAVGVISGLILVFFWLVFQRRGVARIHGLGQRLRKVGIGALTPAVLWDQHKSDLRDNDPIFSSMVKPGEAQPFYDPRIVRGAAGEAATMVSGSLLPASADDLGHDDFEAALWKRNVSQALAALTRHGPNLEPQAGRFLADAEHRKSDIEKLQSMVRQLTDMLNAREPSPKKESREEPVTSNQVIEDAAQSRDATATVSKAA
jgi:hypothetical protein